ncbi:MAG TPA: Flp family type IVb pilin [Alphaproteobacteria bacterium]|nr:Flp family type IVb pilin [Alphaproteobacteria bacterium]HNS45125.1 Flp family type IVb pilin [Alphaproteobacteria bacterium]
MPFLFIKSWFRDERGATAVEYGLVAAGIALAIAVAVFALGDTIIGMFDEITAYLQS